MRDAGHRTPDAGHRTAKKAKIIYPPPRGVDITNLSVQWQWVIKRYFTTFTSIVKTKFVVELKILETNLTSEEMIHFYLIF